jgi:hypothetical protein
MAASRTPFSSRSPPSTLRMMWSARLSHPARLRGGADQLDGRLIGVHRDLELGGPERARIRMLEKDHAHGVAPVHQAGAPGLPAADARKHLPTVAQVYIDGGALPGRSDVRIRTWLTQGERAPAVSAWARKKPRRARVPDGAFRLRATERPSRGEAKLGRSAETTPARRPVFRKTPLSGVWDRAPEP